MTEVTDEQVDSFISEFDNNMYPKESASFSVAPDRDGSGDPAKRHRRADDYYRVSADQADDTVTALVDNVRDANFTSPPPRTARPSSRASSTRCSATTPTAT